MLHQAYTDIYLVLVRSKTEVLNSLSSILRPSEKEGVASGRSSQGQLIQSQGLATSSNNTRTSGRSESKSGNTELGNSEEAVVISDCANNDDRLVVGLFGGVRDNSRDRDWRSIDTGHKESAQNNLVE
jgi:hypothetical protein